MRQQPFDSANLAHDLSLLDPAQTTTAHAMSHGLTTRSGSLLALITNTLRRQTQNWFYSHSARVILLTVSSLSCLQFLLRCEAPGFLAVIWRAGPRRPPRGGYTFGFSAIQLKNFIGGDLWIHCQLAVCNDSQHCFTECGRNSRKGRFSAEHDVYGPASEGKIYVKDGPFQIRGYNHPQQPVLIVPAEPITQKG